MDTNLDTVATEVQPVVESPAVAPTAPQSAPEATPALTDAQIIAEATNDPQLSTDEFMFGGQKFKVVSLGYRQYLQFISKLEPILKTVSSKIKDGVGLQKSPGSRVELPGLILTGLADIDGGNILKFCSSELPAMVQIVCNMERIAANKNETNLITDEWVEDHADNPFELIDIVLRQVNKNKMIVQFASFFAQVLPMFMGAVQSPAK